HPGCTIETHHGYFDAAPRSAENGDVLHRIHRFAPHLLLIGMGMPRQERWIIDNLSALPSCVVLPAGGTMDYVAGATAAAPRWLGQLGLEWLFRLGHEPKRLWRRYLIEPRSLIVPLAQEFAARYRIAPRASHRHSWECAFNRR